MTKEYIFIFLLLILITSSAAEVEDETFEVTDISNIQIGLENSNSIDRYVTDLSNLRICFENDPDSEIGECQNSDGIIEMIRFVAETEEKVRESFDIETGEEARDIREYELSGDPLDTDLTVDPNGRWELSGDIREDDGEIRVDPGPGESKRFELVEGDRPKEFELFRPDFDLTASAGTEDPISVGREIEIIFEDKRVKGESSRETCEKISPSQQDISSCTHETEEEDTEGLEIRGKIVDESPENNLAAVDTVSINVKVPEPWEQRTISLVEGESEDEPEEFSPSVSCEDPVKVSYNGNSLSIESGGLSKSRGTPGEGTSISLGDFSLEVENRDSNGDLEVTPRCGPEVDYVTGEDGSEDCQSDELWCGNRQGGGTCIDRDNYETGLCY